MIFDRVANVIMKHSKLIIGIWVIVLLCSAPFIMKAGDKISYDNSTMAGDDSESIKGMKVIGEYFNNSNVEPASVCLLVVTYEDAAGKAKALALSEQLNTHIADFKTADGKQKLSAIMPYGNYSKDNSDKGMALIAMTYKGAFANTAASDTSNLRDWVSHETANFGLTTYLTGMNAITHDMMQGASKDISKIDVFSVLFILILVGLFFRSIFTSAMPPITIGIGIGVALCALFFVADVMNIFFITEMFIIVAMLGAGCDYCIFIIARYKEERRKGADHEHAMKESITWAGESITTSGLAVMIGFGSMAICSFQMISGMGVMLAIGIAIALLAALTLITSILNILGEKIFWPSKISSFDTNKKGWYSKFSKFADKYFHKSVKFSIKHAKAIVIAALIFTVPMAYVAATSESSYDMIGTTATGESKNGLNQIEKYTDGGMLMPPYEVIEFNDPIANVTYSGTGDSKVGLLTWTANSSYDKLKQLSATILAKDDNIGRIGAPVKWSEIAESGKAAAGPQLSGESNPAYLLRILEKCTEKSNDIALKGVLGGLSGYVSKSMADPTLAYDKPSFVMMADYNLNYGLGALGGAKTDTGMTLTFAKMTFVTKEQAMSDNSIKSLHKIADEVKKLKNENSDIIKNTWLTGISAAAYEVSESVNKEFLKVVAIAMILIFLLLFFVLKSYFTPLRSILTILMSVIWTIAMTHLLFTDVLGYGVIWMVPIILIVICLGLGMDYDILLTTRIKENHSHRGMSNDEAISEALVNTGSVITICGLIMAGAFGTLMLSDMIMLKMFGFALSFAILVDALIVRTYIVPALMHLMGEWCWKGPKFLHKKESKE